MMYYVGMPGHVIVSGKLEECDRSHQAVWALQLPHRHRVREPIFPVEMNRSKTWEV